MKRLLMYLLFLPFLAVSQNIIGEYETPLGEKFEVHITNPNKKGNFDFLIFAKSSDAISTQACLVVSSKKIEYFHSFLLKLKANHIEWINKLKENNIDNVDKVIPIKEEKYFAAKFLYGDWQSVHAIYLLPHFKTFPIGHCTILRSSRLVAFGNKYINSDGFFFLFSKPEDFDDLINLVSMDKANEFFNKKKNIDDILK